VTQHSKNSGASDGADLAHFVHHQLSSLSTAFAESPLAQLRVSTPEASIVLVKSARAAGVVKVVQEGNIAERRHGSPWQLHDYLPDGEPGLAYVTVNADVVGVFHPVPDLPASGEAVAPDRVLGYIEALKLRTPVKSGVAGRLVGQVAEDGQAVDFGETLFVVDSGPEAAPAAPAEEPNGVLEPPRV
jgi:acetyl-CoA carboxylase biotin carboxyl carrier protein